MTELTILFAAFRFSATAMFYMFYMFYSHKSFFILTNSRFGAPLAKVGADHSHKIGEHFSVGRVLGYILVFKVFHVVQLRVIPVVV